jgi:hypothetical protein
MLKSIARFLPHNHKTFLKWCIGWPMPQTPKPKEPVVLPEIAGPEHMDVPHWERIRHAWKSKTTQQAREEFTAIVMKKLLLDPGYGRILETPCVQSKFGDEEIYSFALAAIHFGRGDVGSATHVLEDVVKRFPSPLAYNSLARSYLLDDEAKGLQVLLEGYALFPKHMDLVMELATAYYRAWKTAKANEYVSQVVDQLAISRFDQTSFVTEVEAALRNRTLLRDGGADIYNDNFTRNTWWSYWNSAVWYSPYQDSHRWLFDFMENAVGAVLDQEAAELNHVFDFGTLCGHYLYNLSKRYPKASFAGIDRQLLIKELNDYMYRVPNLAFHADDIRDYIPKLGGRSRNAMMMHARTATFCYPEYLRRLYGACAGAGVRNVVLFEGNSLCQHNFEFYDFDNMPADTVPTRVPLMLHNYPKLLREAGYDVLKVEQLPSCCLFGGPRFGPAMVLIVARLR